MEIVPRFSFGVSLSSPGFTGFSSQISNTRVYDTSFNTVVIDKAKHLTGIVLRFRGSRVLESRDKIETTDEEDRKKEEEEEAEKEKKEKWSYKREPRHVCVVEHEIRRSVV